MAIGLTYDDTLYRVQTALSGLNSAISAVKVERSFNQLLWSTVRGGTTLPISGGSGSLDDYEYAVSADGSLTTYYRVTTADPAPGLLLDGSAGNYASTPDDPSLDVTGDIWVAAYVRPDDWTAASSQVFAAKRGSGAGQESWQFYVNSDGRINFAWWDSSQALTNVLGEFIQDETGVGDGEWLALGVHLDVDDGGDRVLRFYHAPTLAGPWVQLGGDDTDTGTTSIFNSTAPVEVGSRDGGTANLFAGIVGAVEIRSGDMSGTVVANPDFGAQPNGTTNFTDGAGRTWTINGGAEIVSFETASIVVTESKLVLKSIRFPLLNRAVLLSDYGDLDRPADTGVFGVTGRSFPIATTDVNSSDRFGMDFATNTPDEARRLKLLLALGDVLFLQSPAEVNVVRPPRSMYLVPDSSAVARIGHTSRRRHSVPFTEVASPSPLVTGSTLVWQTVFDTFGSWESLISANPTWADLLATVSDPGDAVVF